MIDTKDCELSALREQVGLLSETKAAVIGELDASTSRLSRTSEEVDMLQKELRLKTEKLDTERSRLEAVLEEMSSVQQEASAHAERMQAEMQQAQQSLEARDGQIAGLEVRMVDAVARAQTASDRYDEAQREHLLMIAGWYPKSSPFHATCLWLGVKTGCVCTFCI